MRDLARDLLDAHELRAADSLQLAAALTWCQQRPAKRNFFMWRASACPEPQQQVASPS